jgi:hypothetical protein
MRTVRIVTCVVMVNVGCCLIAQGQMVAADQAAVRRNFEAEYEAWKKHCDRVAWSSRGSDYLGSEHFENIVAMGPVVLPYLVEKRIEDPTFTWASWIRTSVARVCTDPAVNPWAREFTTTWWRGGKKQVAQRFDLLNSERKSLKAKGIPKEEAAMRRSIRALGIAALPLIMDELRAGDPNLIEIVQQLTGGEAKIEGETAAEKTASCLTWWEENKERWLIPFPNKRPTANAGQDQQVSSEEIVFLDGTLSTDEDKDGLTSSWRQVAGPPVKLSDARVMRPTFTAPKVEKETVLVFELVVNDGSPKNEVHPACQSGESEPAMVRITVEPRR